MKHLHPDWAVIEMKNENHAKETKTRLRKAGIKNRSFPSSGVRIQHAHRTGTKPTRPAGNSVKEYGPAQKQPPNATLCTLKQSKKFTPDLWDFTGSGKSCQPNSHKFLI
jgi:hypothetical protein